VSTVLAIDPGNVQSAYCLIDVDTRRPLEFAKLPNDELRAQLRDPTPAAVIIEMVATYGMPVGAEVFETCVWIGRFIESAIAATGRTPELIYRSPVRAHHCHSNKAKDANVTRALVDRFAPGQTNFGKGTKTAPGWFHGFQRDVWQAYALAVYAADKAADRG
jgi:hypothetical protein